MRIIAYTILLLTFPLFLQAQKQKKELKPDDYSLWRSIDKPQISNNGKWLCFEVNPFWADGHLHIRNTETGKVEMVPRAYDAKFASCSEFVVFKIKPQEETLKKEKLAKKKKDQLPKDSLGVMMLNNMKIFKYPNVKSFLMPEKTSDWFAFTLESKDKTKDEEKEENKNKIKTETLIIAQPKNAKYITFEKVNDYFVPKDSKWFGYVTNSGDVKNTADVNIFNTQSGTSFSVFKGEGEARNIVIDGESSQLAFLFSPDTAEDKIYRLYLATERVKEARVILDTSSKRLPKGYIISPNAKLFFSDDNTKLFMGTAPFVKSPAKENTPDDEKVELDIWTWKDTRPMSQQLKELEKDLKRTYLAVYYPSRRLFNQLATETVPDVQLERKNDSRIALGSSAIPYELQASWEARNKKDYFLVDVETGRRNKIISASQFQVSLSPEGKFVAYYEEKDSLWYLYDVEQNTTKPLHSKDLTRFYNYEFDNPGPPPPFGIAAWTENDKTILIYDKYDIWEFETDGSNPPVNITKGKIQGKIINRYYKLNNDAYCINKNEHILVYYVNEDSKEEGFYIIDRRNRENFKLLVKDNCRFFSVIKAKNTKDIIYRRSTYTEFGDLWQSDTEFSKNQRISDINPQQKDFLWGSVEFVSWKFKEKTMSGLLYKPDNFDPKKKYPMITYFYEKSSHNIHNNHGVVPSRSVINIPLYTSNGYVIFVPDIEFEIGKPGESALNIILSGVYAQIEKGFVDQNRLGIHGQSWGGYLALYVITRTPIFKAAMAGAPVSNMTSAYAAIRRETGINRIYQYESGQSRIGASLWNRRDLYIENSPLFFADKIQTPLLIMSNDNDGAVPWTQGQELILSMRRLQKPCWMLNYNNDDHNLSKKQNRIDLSIRMFQFFNHYLKDSPMPEWMNNGIPAKDKGRTLGY